LVAEVRRRTVAGAEGRALRQPARVAVDAIARAERWLGEASGRAGAAVEAGARRFALTVGRATALALLVEHAAWALTHERDPRPAAAARRFAQAGVDLIGESLPTTVTRRSSPATRST